MIKALIIDCFGVLYKDAFKEFINNHANRLELYLQKESNLPKKPSYPHYYYDLAQQVDMNEITEEKFYSILSIASGEKDEAIKQLMNQTEGMLYENVFQYIKDVKKKYHLKLGLIANADRGFLQKFLHHHNTGEIFDVILTSSEIKKPKISLEFMDKLAGKLNIAFEDLLFIDNSAKNIEIVSKMGIKALQFKDLEELKVSLNTYLHG